MSPSPLPTRSPLSDVPYRRWLRVAPLEIARPAGCDQFAAASLAISAGANPKVVQRMHASAAMTLDVYADLFDSGLDTVAETVAKMWPRQA